MSRLFCKSRLVLLLQIIFVIINPAHAQELSGREYRTPEEYRRGSAIQYENSQNAKIPSGDQSSRFGFSSNARGVQQRASANYQDLNEGVLSTFSRANFTDAYIKYAVGNILRLLEGSFGALIMVVAGVMAIISAAMGSYKQAMAMLVVAVGAFVLRSLISLFFGVDFPAFGGEDIVSEIK